MRDDDWRRYLVVHPEPRVRQCSHRGVPHGDPRIQCIGRAHFLASDSNTATAKLNPFCPEHLLVWLDRQHRGEATIVIPLPESER